MSERAGDKPNEAQQDAAEAFVQGMIPRQDFYFNAGYLWHGWALRDAFHAGAAFARSSIAPREMELLEHQANLVGKIARLEEQVAECRVERQNAINTANDLDAKLSARSATGPSSEDFALVRSALHELVHLKQIKRMAESGVATPHDLEKYDNTKEAVWKRAEAVLRATDGGDKTNG